MTKSTGQKTAETVRLLIDEFCFKSENLLCFKNKIEVAECLYQLSKELKLENKPFTFSIFQRLVVIEKGAEYQIKLNSNQFIDYINVGWLNLICNRKLFTKSFQIISSIARKIRYYPSSLITRINEKCQNLVIVTTDDIAKIITEFENESTPTAQKRLDKFKELCDQYVPFSSSLIEENSDFPNGFYVQLTLPKARFLIENYILKTDNDNLTSENKVALLLVIYIYQFHASSVITDPKTINNLASKGINGYDDFQSLDATKMIEATYMHFIQTLIKCDIPNTFISNLFPNEQDNKIVFFVERYLRSINIVRANKENINFNI